MNKFITISLLFLFNSLAFGDYLSREEIKEVLLHPTLRTCMRQLVAEAKDYDRRNRSIESAAWIIRDGYQNYRCEFWRDELRIPGGGGFDWDGYIPHNTILTIHTHPKKSAGIQPSEADMEFNETIDKVGLVLSYKSKAISANYPGSSRYKKVLSRKDFRRSYIKSNLRLFF